MKTIKLATLTAALVAAGLAHAADKATPKPDSKLQALVAKYIEASFLPGEGQDLSRLKQDETLQACNLYRDNPPEKIAAEINAREKATIKYPADGKLMGDWKRVRNSSLPASACASVASSRTSRSGRRAATAATAMPAMVPIPRRLPLAPSVPA